MIDPDKRNAAWYAVFGALYADLVRSHRDLHETIGLTVWYADEAMLSLAEYDKNKEENQDDPSFRTW